MSLPIKIAAASVLAVPLITIAPSTALADVSSCGGVLRGAGDGGTLTKTITNVTQNADGSTTIRYRYTSDRGEGSFRLRDCAFIDANGNSKYDKGEQIVGSTDFKGRPSSGFAKITVTVTLAEGERLCDRLALSGTSNGTGFTDKSNVACVTGDYPPPPPY